MISLLTEFHVVLTSRGSGYQGKQSGERGSEIHLVLSKETGAQLFVPIELEYRDFYTANMGVRHLLTGYEKHVRTLKPSYETGSVAQRGT